jgi:peroxiredoxin Q/BCP
MLSGSGAVYAARRAGRIAIMLEPGSLAPDFELPDQDGRPVKLSDFRGQRVVVYFYPKADTPGCTAHALAFPLLSDERHAVAEAYGVWVQKSMYGRTYLGNERTTFIVDPDGRIATVLRKVKPAEHDALVLGALGRVAPPAA